ncbi:MAG TPA: NAD(P)/FAD-dependent oxidoreductase [Kofleriaceae bacterium]|jgi:flavin-dependent dehydrogenase|nr:NAD(P)/FAD-dependent oxidoreductase [Kofleriaceae bacterium]
METHDVIVVGGGPAGSSCARVLARGGARVVVVDRAVFPRVKLCAGWISAPLWDVLELAPREYPAGLWPWDTCHVHYRGRGHAIACRGWFIRRYELDDHLLRTSGAELRLGLSVKEIDRDADGLWNVAGLRARHLVGAGGTHCPVARVVAPPRRAGPVGVQELEFPLDPAAIARARAGRDGEPELLLHDDLRGYAWNVPKTDWINIGVGTLDPTEVRAAWGRARDHFRGAGHVPDGAEDALEHVKGHSYYLYDPVHLDGAARIDADGKGGVFLAGDALGLAQPMTAEGILPAALSGRVLAEALLDGEPEAYPARLAAHPVLADYRRLHGLRDTVAGLRRRRAPAAGARPRGLAADGAVGRLAERAAARAVATGFAWMFSGARLPAPRLVDRALDVLTRRRSP